jgi:4-hydroxybenzoate polyprenyltransferase
MPPLLTLTRIHRPIGIWLTFFPACWAVLLASPEQLRWDMLAICLIGAVLVRSAGCILNDMADRKLDAQVARTRGRPLASGGVSLRAAIALLVVLLLLAALLLPFLPIAVFWLALLALPMIAAYPWMKRVTWWPQAFLGLTFNLSAPMGWASVTGRLDWAALLLYLGAVAWTFGYDTIYAHQDRADDIQAGIKSSARALGARTGRVVGLSYAVFVTCVVAAGWQTGAGVLFYLGVAGAAGHLAWQLARLDIDKPALCGLLFRSNQWVGLILGMGTVLDAMQRYY